MTSTSPGTSYHREFWAEFLERYPHLALPGKDPRNRGVSHLPRLIASLRLKIELVARAEGSCAVYVVDGNDVRTRPVPILEAAGARLGIRLGVEPGPREVKRPTGDVRWYLYRENSIEDPDNLTDRSTLIRWLGDQAELYERALLEELTLPTAPARSS